MGRDFEPKFGPVPEAQVSPAQDSVATDLMRKLLSQRHKVMMMAAVQLIITALFPGRFHPVPLAALALAIATSQLIRFLTPSSADASSPLANVVPGRATSQLPLPDGSFGRVPASQPLVVFQLGVQFNHPRGVLAPHAKEVGDRFAALNQDLLRRRDELGLISASNWRGADGADTRLTTYYFKDVQSLHRFAHEALHREAWDWYNRVTPGHIGIFHETYEVRPHSYENIYANCRPLLLGAGVVKCPETEGESEWRNTLVSADHVGLKGQWKRMNREANGTINE